MVKETAVPISKFSAIFVNVATTILPCVGFLWGVYAQIKIMELRVENLEKLSTISAADRTQLHDGYNRVDNKLVELSSRADNCKERWEDVKGLLQQHMGKSER